MRSSSLSRHPANIEKSIKTIHHTYDITSDESRMKIHIYRNTALYAPYAYRIACLISGAVRTRRFSLTPHGTRAACGGPVVVRTTVGRAGRVVACRGGAWGGAARRGRSASGQTRRESGAALRRTMVSTMVVQWATLEVVRACATYAALQSFHVRSMAAVAK